MYVCKRREGFGLKRVCWCSALVCARVCACGCVGTSRSEVLSTIGSTPRASFSVRNTSQNCHLVQCVCVRVCCVVCVCVCL